MGLMPGATPLPKRGEVFFDYRRTDRSLRLSPHPDAGVVVLSIWNGGICQATFQLPGDQVELFAETLRHTSPRDTPVQGPETPEVFRTGQYDTQPNIV
jgi:hypothetical protein